MLLDLFERYGPIVYEKIGPRKPVIHVFDLSDIETVYRNEDKTPKIFPLNEFVKSYRKMKGKSAGLGHRYVHSSAIYSARVEYYKF